MQLELQSVEYQPGRESVLIVCKKTDGLFEGHLLNIPSTQTDLQNRVPPAEVRPWSDEECLAEVEARIAPAAPQSTVVIASVDPTSDPTAPTNVPETPPG